MAQTETAEYSHQRHEKKKCFCGKLSPGGTYLSRHTLKKRHILVPDPKSSHALVPPLGPCGPPWPPQRPGYQIPA